MKIFGWNVFGGGGESGAEGGGGTPTEKELAALRAKQLQERSANTNNPTTLDKLDNRPLDPNSPSTDLSFTQQREQGTAKPVSVTDQMGNKHPL